MDFSLSQIVGSMCLHRFSIVRPSPDRLDIIKGEEEEEEKKIVTCTFAGHIRAPYRSYEDEIETSGFAIQCYIIRQGQTIKINCLRYV